MGVAFYMQLVGYIKPVFRGKSNDTRSHANGTCMRARRAFQVHVIAAICQIE